jgi:hypothetical protein
MAMKHSSADFTAHMLSLLKNTGPSGPTGPTPDKPFNLNEKAGTTRGAEVGPVDLDWSQHVCAIGPGKTPTKQSLRDGGTAGTSGTTNFEQGPALGLPGKCPPEWYAILAELKARNPVEWLSAQRWCEVVSDVEIFLSRWGNAAHQLGWTALDLFGVHPMAPASRFDMMGLVLLIDGGEVVTLTSNSATIRRMSGTFLTFRKSDQAGAVLLSEIRS